jgi:hypothetical protein
MGACRVYVPYNFEDRKVMKEIDGEISKQSSLDCRGFEGLNFEEIIELMFQLKLIGDLAIPLALIEG